MMEVIIIFNLIKKIKNKICEFCHVNGGYLQQERTKTMTNTNLLDKFKWNREYIISHKLDDEVVEEAFKDEAPEIKQVADEVFVEHPRYKGYYVSQYGRVISLKCLKPKLLSANLGGAGTRQYYYYGLMRPDKSKPDTKSGNRLVADVFCPNFWQDKSYKFDAHHINKIKTDNTWTNLVLIPVPLHKALDRIKKIVLLQDGIIEYSNPLDLVYDTGLTLEDIILTDRKKKPLKSDGKYSIFNVKGHLIGYQYYPKKKQKKEK